jgi:hypothetical protein
MAMKLWVRMQQVFIYQHFKLFGVQGEIVSRIFFKEQWLLYIPQTALQFFKEYEILGINSAYFPKRNIS